MKTNALILFPIKFTHVKKIVASILALLFLSSSMGMTVHMHFCMDKLIEANLWHTATQDAACSNCGMKTKDTQGCCKDEQKVFKTDNYQQSDVTKIPALEAFALALPAQPLYLETVIISSRVKQLPRSNAPPDAGSVPTYLFNCTFRI